MQFVKRDINQKTLDRLGEFLSYNKLTLVCAESMSAGFLSSTFALEMHSGDYFFGSIVAYDNKVKKDVLSISPELIEQHTAESIEVTLAMIDGLENIFPSASVHISITGLAFKSNNPKQDRPIGTVYFAFRYKHYTHVYDRHFEGNAGEIIVSACNTIYEELYEWLKPKFIN